MNTVELLKGATASQGLAFSLLCVLAGVGYARVDWKKVPGIGE